ncbi:MAG TPA: TSUP family transporter [Burkholderiales bacterium]|nr:TSUP family transporter [Burkholderiales bacterium]
MTPSILVFGLLALSTLVTAFISGILGMAGGMILMGVLLALLPLPAAMMLHGISQLASNGGRALMLRREVDWRVFRGYVAGAALALAFFALTHIVVGKAAALIAMGLTPFAALLLPEKLHLNVERRGHSFLCGLVCLTLNLTAGIAGPILDVFFVRSKMSRHAVVATKALTQTLSHLIKILYFGGVMALQGAEVEPALAATMVVLAIVGTSLSRQVLERISDASFRQWTRWTVMTLGVMYLASGLRLVLTP